MNTRSIAIASAFFALLAVGWALPLLASEEIQTDSSIASGIAEGVVTVEAFAEASAPTLRVSRDVVETYIPVTFDASAFDLQSPSTAVYAWDLTGDGEADALSGAPLVFYTYERPGTYAASVHITDAAGTDVVSDPIEIVVTNRPPRASFSVASESIADLAPVSFRDLSQDVDGRIVAWMWDFGDETTSSAPNPSHAYVKPGTFVVVLVVTDDAGTRSEPFAISLSVENTPPVASFSAPSVAVVGQVVIFTDQSFDPSVGGRIVYIAWDFGDGSYVTGTPRTSDQYTHAYATPNEYIVRLYVIDENGGLAVARGTIRVD